MKYEEMIQILSEAEPAGVNAEYDSLYLALDELAIGVPASQMGDSVIQGQDPDYKQLRKNCLELWKQTRDLRVAVFFTVANLCLDGLEGLRDGLLVIRFLVDELWTEFYPQLDPDDDNDPTERINILNILSPQPSAYMDPVMFLFRLREKKLIDSLRYTLRDHMIASGELDAGEERVDAALLHAEMLAIPMEQMQIKVGLVSEILELLSVISDVMNEKMSGRAYINFDSLEDELKRLKRFYSGYVYDNSVEKSEEEGMVAEEAENTAGIAGVRSVRTVFNLNDFTPSSRVEALMLLRKSAEYFQHAEPTSPIPFFINRALRMAEMNFMDLLSEIAPDSVERGRDILGVKNSEDNDSY